MSDGPNSHTQDHQRGVKPVKPGLRGNQVAVPALCKLDDTVDGSGDDAQVADYEGGDEELEFAGLGEGCWDAVSAGVAARAVPEEKGCEGEDDVADALDYDTCFLGMLAHVQGV